MTTTAEHIGSPIRGEGRERILDEARSLFLGNGFAATSMQEIADSVGMTKPALYYHFRDKQDLLMAVLTREMEQGREAFREILTSDESLAARLEAGAVWSFSRIRGDMGRLMSDMHRVCSAEIVQKFKQANPMPVEMVASMLDEGKIRGEIAHDEDTNVLAGLFVGMIFGQLAMQNDQEIQSIDAGTMGRTVARVFVNGVRTT